MSVYKLVSMLQVMANFGRAQDCVCENVTVSAASNVSTIIFLKVDRITDGCRWLGPVHVNGTGSFRSDLGDY